MEGAQVRAEILLDQGSGCGSGDADRAQDVAHQMDLAALPRRAGEHPGDRGFQSGVRIRDDQAHPAESAILEASEERGPEDLVLAVTDIHAEHFTVTVAGHTGRHHDGPGR